MDKFKRFIKYDSYILFLDIVAVNAAYFLALLLRFSINIGKVDPLIEKYLYTTTHFAPFYALICVIVFFIFRLYGGMWRYAGIGDVNRIVIANAITAIINVAATLLFFERMPVTYYVMGAVIQLMFIAFIRFAYRLAVLEKRQVSKSNAANAVIIGAGENGNQVIKMLNVGVSYRPIAVIDSTDKFAGQMIDGLPICAKEEFEKVIAKSKAKIVFIADNKIDEEFRKHIRKYCQANDILFRDYTSFFNYSGENDSFAELIEAQDTSVDGKRVIPFSPPDITEVEIREVVETLRSGWITTGPRTKLLERRLAAYIETGRTNVDTEKDPSRWANRVACLNSATAAEELNLRILGIREGDEVIVPAYTYTASASAAIHCGATIKFVDIQKDGDPITHMPEMDYEALEKAITPKTKAIIAVDLGGIVCDYDKLFEIVEKTRSTFTPLKANGDPLTDLASRIQTSLGRVAVVADCAHSLGGSRIVNGEKKYCGAIADFSSFSFHAVKNFTTAEGGASAWRAIEGVDNQEIYKMYQLLSLHGQSKDALAKTKAGAWEYDIVGPWYKCNMTDIMAAIGLRQLDRYLDLEKRREEIIKRYDAVCDELGLFHMNHHTEDMDSSNHLYLIRIPGISVEKRNEIITQLAENGVSTNVHYKPMPMMTAYSNMGWDIKDFPNTYDYYQNLITLPLHTRLTDEDVDFVIENLKLVISGKED